MNLLTFDIEDWYCNCVYMVLDWEKYECRLHGGVDQILKELGRQGLKATCFAQGGLSTIIQRLSGQSVMWAIRSEATPRAVSAIV